MKSRSLMHLLMHLCQQVAPDPNQDRIGLENFCPDSPCWDIIDGECRLNNIANCQTLDCSTGHFKGKVIKDAFDADPSEIFVNGVNQTVCKVEEEDDFLLFDVKLGECDMSFEDVDGDFFRFYAKIMATGFSGHFINFGFNVVELSCTYAAQFNISSNMQLNDEEIIGTDSNVTNLADAFSLGLYSDESFQTAHNLSLPIDVRQKVYVTLSWNLDALVGKLKFGLDRCFVTNIQTAQSLDIIKRNCVLDQISAKIESDLLVDQVVQFSYNAFGIGEIKDSTFQLSCTLSICAVDEYGRVNEECNAPVLNDQDCNTDDENPHGLTYILNPYDFTPQDIMYKIPLYILNAHGFTMYYDSLAPGQEYGNGITDMLPPAGTSEIFIGCGKNSSDIFEMGAIVDPATFFTSTIVNELATSHRNFYIYYTEDGYAALGFSQIQDIRLHSWDRFDLDSDGNGILTDSHRLSFLSLYEGAPLFRCGKASVEDPNFYPEYRLVMLFSST